MATSRCVQLRFLADDLEREPDRPVVITGGGAEPAGRFAARVRSWQGELDRLGVSPGTAVALLFADRGDVLAAMLACLSKAIVFVPVMPAEPASRLRHLLTASGAAAALFDTGGSRSVGRLAGACCQGDARGTRLDGIGQPRTFGPGACYVYFTSGTTGQPRPLLGLAESVQDFVEWEISEFGIGPGDRCSQLTRPSFDAYLRDCLVPLSAGATLHLPPDDPFAMAPGDLARWLRSERISVAHTVPTLLRRIADGPDGALPDLRCLLLSGEPLVGPDVARWQAAGNDPAVLANLYGPTETTMIKLFHRVGPPDASRQRVPVGKALRGSQAYIADTELRPVPAGTSGEVIIRTAHGTGGYLDAEENGPGGFARNPFTSDEADILYRTGDLGRQLADGDIELIGRMDDQLKLAGARIEPGEVEHALLRHDGVREAVVDVVGDQDARRLAAWLVARGPVAPPDEQVRLTASEYLPAELIPGHLIWVPSLPVTSTGKADRAALRRAYAQMVTGQDATEPATPTERLVREVMTAVIGKAVGTRADFFALGGTSLAATQVVARIRRKLGCDLGVRELFEHPTVAGLAARIDLLAPAVDERAGGEPPAGEPVPSAAQRRIWFVHQLRPDDPAYTITTAAHVPAPVDVGALRRAATAVLRYREALRCAFSAPDGELVISVSEPGPASVDVRDVPGGGTALHQLISSKAREVFPLESGDLLRLTVAVTGGDTCVIVMSTHHIVADEMSVWLLAADLLDAYQAELGSAAWRPGGGAAWRPPGDLDRGYWRFALAQGELLASARYGQALEHWVSLARAAPQLGIADADGRDGRDGTATQRFAFDQHTAARLRQFARDARVTLFNVLVGALHVALSAFSGESEIVTTTSVDLRDSVETEHSVGMFANTVVMRSWLDAGTAFGDAARALRDQWAGSQPHLWCPYDEVVAAVQPDQAPGSRALSEVNFDYHEMSPMADRLGDAGSRAVAVDHASAKFPIDISIEHSGGNLSGEVRYQAASVVAGTVSELVQMLLEIGQAVSARPDVTVGALVKGEGLADDFASES